MKKGIQILLLVTLLITYIAPVSAASASDNSTIDSNQVATAAKVILNKMAENNYQISTILNKTNKQDIKNISSAIENISSVINKTNKHDLENISYAVRNISTVLNKTNPKDIQNLSYAIENISLLINKTNKQDIKNISSTIENISNVLILFRGFDTEHCEECTNNPNQSMLLVNHHER